MADKKYSKYETNIIYLGCRNGQPLWRTEAT